MAETKRIARINVPLSDGEQARLLRLAAVLEAKDNCRMSLAEVVRRAIAEAVEKHCTA